jgi:aquaporin Z
MVDALKKNWQVYLMEGICLGLFMASAALFGTLLEYPGSVVHQSIDNGFVRLCLMGLAMGATATLIIYSPMGKLSGAHMNPAVTLTFFTLGKIKKQDAFFYTIFQITGGMATVYLMSLILGEAFRESPVNYVITAPGRFGTWGALIAEMATAFIMMVVVLIISNHPLLARYTGVAAGFLVMVYVILAGPISGFGMNPARTLASAIPANQYPALWVYLTAPFIGMLSASIIYKRFVGAVKCAKMHHSRFYTCIFNCGYCEHV